jgi:hypothetical protein
MDCLLKTATACKDLCSLKCCQSLVCEETKEDHLHPELRDAFYEQSNFYRRAVALSCPQAASVCQTRAQFFSEQLSTSPIYSSECDQLHKTTIMSDSCKRIIINYCSNQNLLEDKSTCTQFLNTGSLVTLYDWSTECNEALTLTKAGQFPNMTLVCYEYVLNQCVSGGGCGCFWGENKGNNQIQLVPCPFYVWQPTLYLDALNLSVIILLFIFYSIFTWQTSLPTILSR